MARLLLVLVVLLCAAPGTAAAAPTCPGEDDEFPSGLVFGVGPLHVLAGTPERGVGDRAAAGAIVVRDGGRRAHVVTLAHVPGAGAPAAGDRFGAALATGMLDRADSCTDSVAGAPGRNVTGEAYLLRGSRSARPSAATVIRAPDAAPGDEFGAAIAVSGRADVYAHDVWIGAPGRDVAGQADAGAIYHYAIGEAGEITFVGVLSQGGPLVPDAPEAGDRFGELLSPVAGGVIAGLPHEDIGDLRDAGAIEQLRLAPDGAGLPGVFVDQAAGGLERPEAGDRFGAAVSGDFRVLAGAPGEDVAGRADAGLVALYLLNQNDDSLTGRLRPRRTFRQGAGGVPGRPEAGDRFGSALASGASLRCQEDSAIAIGVPGEDLRGLRDAGAVALVQPNRETSCGTRRLAQGHGLPGRPRSRERTGETLGIAPDIPGLDEDTYDTLLVGVPSGEILTINAGHADARGRLRAPPATPGYGSVFARPSAE